MSALNLSMLSPHERKGLYKVAVANSLFVMCYKFTCDLFLTVGEGLYLEKWLLLGTLLLVDD